MRYINLRLTYLLTFVAALPLMLVAAGVPRSGGRPRNKTLWVVSACDDDVGQVGDVDT